MDIEVTQMEIVTENSEIFRFFSQDIIEAKVIVKECAPIRFQGLLKQFSYVRIHLKASANSPKADLTKYSQYDRKDRDRQVLPFDRFLGCPDIAQVYLDEDRGGFVPWEEGKNETENKLQYCCLKEDGSLLIEIGDDKDYDV